MSLVSHPFVCDICGKRRENDTNHWYVAWEFMLWHDGAPVPTVRGLAVAVWHAETALEPGKKHLCGVNCAMRAQEKFLTQGTLEPKATPPTAAVH